MLANLNQTPSPIYVQSVAPSNPVDDQTLWYEPAKKILWLWRTAPVGRWESLQVYEWNFSGGNITAVETLWANPQQEVSGVQLKIERYELTFISGTAQSASAHWSFSVVTRNLSNANTTLYTVTTQTATTAAQWFSSIFQNTSHLIDPVTVKALGITGATVGTVTSASFSFKVSYRLVRS